MPLKWTRVLGSEGPWQGWGGAALGDVVERLCFEVIPWGSSQISALLLSPHVTCKYFNSEPQFPICKTGGTNSPIEL